jgi:hypothetical protein
MPAPARRVEVHGRAHCDGRPGLRVFGDHRHSRRFRQVSTLSPRLVTEASGGDLAKAAADSDEQVAARVAAWETAQGWVPRDWHAFGRVRTTFPF